MIRTTRNLFRLLALARTLARHDALFVLETLGVAPTIVVLARLASRRRAPGRPQDRCDRARAVTAGAGAVAHLPVVGHACANQGVAHLVAQEPVHELRARRRGQDLAENEL